MAINLATKYSKQIQSVYTQESIISSRVSNAYSLLGVKTVQIVMPQTVPMGNYNRSGANRYGTPVEMQDTIQELTMTQDKSAAITIDKGNNMEQEGVKSAGKMVNLQVQEQCTPMFDTYCLERFANLAGTIAGVANAPTKTTIVEMISNASVAMDNALTPQSNRYLVVSPNIYALIRLSTEFIGIEALGQKAVAKGSVGEIFGFSIVKAPANYFPANCYFIAWHKDAVLAPHKLHEAKLNTEPQGISGALLELREMYDAFVLEKKCGGVYAAVKSDKVVDAPTISISGNSATLTASGATIKYTLDGSDPRYSKSAVTYSSAVSMTSGQTIKCYAEKTDMYASAVAEKKNA